MIKTDKDKHVQSCQLIDEHSHTHAHTAWDIAA